MKRPDFDTPSSIGRVIIVVGVTLIIYGAVSLVMSRAPDYADLEGWGVGNLFKMVAVGVGAGLVLVGFLVRTWIE